MVLQYDEGEEIKDGGEEEEDAEDFFVVNDASTNSTISLEEAMRNLYTTEIFENPNLLSVFNAQITSILKAISNMSVSISRTIWDLQDNATLIALLNLIDHPQDSFKHAVNLALQKLLKEIEDQSANATQIIRHSGYSDLNVQTRIEAMEDEIDKNLPSSHSDDGALCKAAQQSKIETMARTYVDSYRNICISAFQNVTGPTLDDASAAFTGVFSTVEMLVGTLFTRQLPAPETVKQEDLKQVNG